MQASLDLQKSAHDEKNPKHIKHPPPSPVGTLTPQRRRFFSRHRISLRVAFQDILYHVMHGLPNNTATAIHYASGK